MGKPVVHTIAVRTNHEVTMSLGEFFERLGLEGSVAKVRSLSTVCLDHSGPDEQEVVLMWEVREETPR